jgi:hypothetical protein
MCRRETFELLGVRECEACGGEGELFEGMWPGNWYEPPSEIFRPCEECGGTGSYIDIPEQLADWEHDPLMDDDGYEDAIGRTPEEEFAE